MKSFADKMVAITGAGSGIGAALARELAGRGAELALSDIDEVGLEATRAAVEANGSRPVSAQRVDVADRAAVEAWADSVVSEHGRVNVIVNNAGVALGATIDRMTYEDLEWLMGINFWGVVYGTKAFLPHLKATGDGHVVNISSVFGLMAIPTQSAYNAAKFGVRGFTDALRMELDMQPCGVSATTVHPGGIKTNIARHARLDESAAELTGSDDPTGEFERLFFTTPESAARQIVRAIERNRRRALLGPDAVAFDLLSRLPAPITQRLVEMGSRLGRSTASSVRNRVATKREDALTT